jgi:hypothetical protein
MKWLETFKYALTQKDVKTIDSLINNIPEFNKLEEMRMAYNVIGEAKKQFEEKQMMIQQRMNNIH